MSEQPDQQEIARTKTESNAAATAHQVGIQQQSKDVHDRKHNPQFYERYTETSLKDSEKWGHLVNEHAPWLADDHILSNRRQVHRLQRELLNKVRAEQTIAGATPGQTLKQKPLLHALSQGVHVRLDEPIPLDAAGQATLDLSDHANYTPPMTAEELSAMDDLANLATARQAMGVDKAGSEALTTATTESRTVREEESEQSAVASVSGVFD